MRFKGRFLWLHSHGILSGGVVTVGPGAVRLKGFRGCLENASEYQFPVRYGSHFCRIKMEA